MSETTRAHRLSALCRTHGVSALYTFGSRAREVLAWQAGEVSALALGPSDVDVGVAPEPGTTWHVEEKVRFAIALEDLWGVGRVDLGFIPELDPFVAAEVIRGERLFASDDYAADEYELYILRRAGDLAPLERERMALILGEEP